MEAVSKKLPKFCPDRYQWLFFQNCNNDISNIQRHAIRILKNIAENELQKYFGQLHHQTRCMTTQGGYFKGENSRFVNI